MVRLGIEQSLISVGGARFHRRDELRKRLEVLLNEWGDDSLNVRGHKPPKFQVYNTMVTLGNAFEKKINRHEVLHDNYDNSGDNLRRKTNALRRMEETKQIFPEFFQNEDVHVV